MKCANCGATLDSNHPSAACAYCGAARSGNAPVLARSLRIETAGEKATILIPQGTELPASMAEVFSTAFDGQSTVEIHLLEGDSDSVSQNRHIGRFQLAGLRPQPRAVPQIQFVLRISAEGALVIEAEEVGTENRRVFKGLIVGVK